MDVSFETYNQPQIVQDENQQPQISNNLTDTVEVSPADARNHGVVINVPLIYINSNEEESIDRVTPNLRVIKYDTLVDLMKIAMKIQTADVNGQIAICDELATKLAQSQEEEYKQFIEFLKWGSEMAKSMDINELYIDVDNVGVTFDVIRNYVCNPETGILVSAIPIGIDGIQLYSQLQNNEATIQSIREQTNDTDFNRIQYYLAHFEKQLTFTPGYVLNLTTKIINLAFFFMCIYSDSIPISGYCSNDLKGNILSYIVDVVVRSRVMQAWQRDDSTKTLLNDLIKNYDNRNHIIRLIQTPTSRERAQYFLNLVKTKRELAKILDPKFYDRYIDTLEKFKLNIDTKNYYLLGAAFITELGKILPDDIMNAQEICKSLSVD